MPETNSKTISYAGGTDIGKIRQKNEDSILCCSFEHSDVSLLAVADGVGGHEGGDVASQLVVNVLKDVVGKAVLQAHSGGGYAENWLELTLHHAIEEANRIICQQQTEQSQFSDMATTVVGMLINQQQLALSYLGDSRCYQYRAGSLTQITEDHTLLQALLNEGKINQSEFDSLPMHHMISKALGLEEHPEIDINCLNFNAGTMFLLCSDGLTNCVSDEQIASILGDCGQLEDCVDELITCANDNGGVDNISVVLVKMDE